MKLFSKEPTKKKLLALAAFVFGAAFLAFAFLFDWNSINSYEAYNTTSTTYVSGKVISVESEDLEKSEDDDRLYLGEQELVITLLQGEKKGETIEVTNYLTKIHSIKVSEGSRVIVCVDAPESAEPYYTIFGYDRTLPLVLLIATFAAAVLLVGRMKGLRALLGVAYSLLLVMVFMMQAIYHGFQPIAVTLLTVLIAAGASLLLLNGFSRRTAVGVLSTLAGVGVTAVVFAVFSALLHLSGYNLDTIEVLLLVESSTGMSIRWLLLAGVLVSALGAVMDVSVGLAASLEELVEVNPAFTRARLMKSGINIGKDMIGTMSNTLIMAYAGSALDTMLCLLAYGYAANQLFSSDYLAIELSQGLCATMGVVLTIPVTTAIAAFFFVRSGETGKSKKKKK